MLLSSYSDRLESPVFIMVTGLYPYAEGLAGFIGKQEYRIGSVFLGVQVLLLYERRHNESAPK